VCGRGEQINRGEKRQTSYSSRSLFSFLFLKEKHKKRMERRKEKRWRMRGT
jgi:hypothetical protein